MRKFRFCLVLLAVFAIMGGTAFSDTAFDHVKVAPNGEGDLIIFPWYLAASGGWQTQISVTNTSNSHATVAKVIVHSHNWSDELLDFLIYLSPNDVWTGYLRYGAAGTYLYSDDDSILVSKPSQPMTKDDFTTYFASPANPVNMTLFPVKCPAASKVDGNTDSTDFGYIEVIEANATTTFDGGSTTISGKQAKYLVYNWYEGTAAATQHTANILTGYQEFQNTEAGSYSALTRASVFADWHNTVFLASSDVSGLINASNNTIGELEAAMGKQDVAMPYVWKGAAATLHFFTFPTKLSYGFKNLSDTIPCDTYDGTPTASKTDDYWGGNSALRAPFKCLNYTATGYDLKENTVTTGPFSGGGSQQKMCEEMQWLPAFIPGDLFTEGWIKYNFKTTPTTFRLQEGTTGSFVGAPVLANVLYIRAASVSQADSAWRQNYVTVPLEGVQYPYYQYADSDNPLGTFVPLVP